MLARSALGNATCERSNRKTVAAARASAPVGGRREAGSVRGLMISSSRFAAGCRGPARAATGGRRPHRARGERPQGLARPLLGKVSPRQRVASSYPPGRGGTVSIVARETGEELVGRRIPGTIIDSCNSIWTFDFERRRFKRHPKGARRERASVRSWRPYNRLLVDSDAGGFLVVLDAGGDRVLRAWRHIEPQCVHCTRFDSTVTSEMSLGELLGLMSRVGTSATSVSSSSIFGRKRRAITVKDWQRLSSRRSMRAGRSREGRRIDRAG